MVFNRFRKNREQEKTDSKKFDFRELFLSYNCPFCKKSTNFDGGGQSILWIALKCITKGSALSKCDFCRKNFRIPAEIFANGILKEIEKILLSYLS